ncbi:MAG: RHS repeat-associated core domain-containing protein, partial [Bacteroidetes bacterium]|nr:RHS repeat-associated core domain-containing protein [Bacteroidota bacterium]
MINPDHIGSTNYVTDKNGDLYEHIEYFPSGETWVKEDKRSETDPKRVAYMFSSRELDEETGLYYVGARYYDPRTSVWQSADPILGAYVGSAGMLDSRNLNLYSYCFQNPVMYVDPTGMQALEEGYDKRDGNSEEKKEVGWIDFPKDKNES